MVVVGISTFDSLFFMERRIVRSGWGGMVWNMPRLVCRRMVFIDASRLTRPACRALAWMTNEGLGPVGQANLVFRHGLLPYRS